MGRGATESLSSGRHWLSPHPRRTFGSIALRDGSSFSCMVPLATEAFFLCLCKEGTSLCHTETPPIQGGTLRVLPRPLAMPHGALKSTSEACAPNLSVLASGAPEVRQSRRVKPRRGAAQGCAAFSAGAGCPVRKFPPRLRTRRAAAGGPPGCAFFAYFLCTSKESKAPAASGAMLMRRENVPIGTGIQRKDLDRVMTCSRNGLRCPSPPPLSRRERGLAPPPPTFRRT